MDKQTDRQRQAHRPPPHTHEAPQTRLVAPGLSFAGRGRGEPLPEDGGCWTHLTTASGLALLPSEGLPYSQSLLQAWGPLFWEEPQKPGASQGDVGPRGPGCRGPGGGGKAVGTHRSAGAPGARPSAASPSSAAQAGAGCAAAATADDLQLPLGAVSPLKELLDELLQPQLGTGLPRCRLLQELVNLHHLPGPGAVSYPSASVRLPTHPPEEPLSGRERRGHSWPWCPLAVTWVDEEPSWEHCPTRWHTQKGKHTLRVIPPPPTKPAPDTPDTLAPQRNTRRPSQSHTATSSLQKHSWAYTYRPHSPVTSPTHSYTRIYVMFIHRHTFTVLRLQSPTNTFTHTLRNIPRCRKAHLQLHQPPGVSRAHSTLKSHVSLYS